MSFRSRDCDVDHALAAEQWFYLFGSNVKSNQTFTYANLQGREQLFDSSPHPYLTGGALTVLRNTVRSWPAEVHAYLNGGGVDYHYRGRIFAKQHASFNAILPAPIDPSTLLGYSSKGWNRFKPTSRNGSLGQAIVELKDIPHMLSMSGLTRHHQRRTKDIAKLAGDHYLNAVFGWLPLLGDIRDLVRNAHNAQKRIDQLSRDNGKFVRRGGNIDQQQTITSSVSTGAFSSPSMVSPLYWGGVKSETQYRTQRSSIRYWFSGRFKYWIAPVGAGRLDKYFQREHVNAILYGLDLSPSLVYELMPWSWLVDWFSSAGSSIANYFEDSKDNLVADYAYTMGNIITSDEYRVVGKTINGQTYYTTQEYLTEVKGRAAASPYGFYAVPPLLTVKQVSILAALGLSKRSKGFT